MSVCAPEGVSVGDGGGGGRPGGAGGKEYGTRVACEAVGRAARMRCLVCSKATSGTSTGIAVCSIVANGRE